VCQRGKTVETVWEGSFEPRPPGFNRVLMTGRGREAGIDKMRGCRGGLKTGVRVVTLASHARRLVDSQRLAKRLWRTIQ
jgi:hypothetical protein